MDLSLVLLALAIILGGILVFKITKRLIRAILSVFALVLLVSFALTVLISLDIGDIREHLSTPRLYLLAHNTTITDGFTQIPPASNLFDDTSLSTHLLGHAADAFTEDHITVLSDDAIEEMNAFYNEELYDEMLTDRYRFYVVDETALEHNGAFVEKMRSAVGNSSYFIVSGYRDDAVHVYPESQFYKLVKRVPQFMLKSLLKDS